MYRAKLVGRPNIALSSLRLSVDVQAVAFESGGYLALVGDDRNFVLVSTKSSRHQPASQTFSAARADVTAAPNFDRITSFVRPVTPRQGFRVIVVRSFCDLASTCE